MRLHALSLCPVTGHQREEGRERRSPPAWPTSQAALAASSGAVGCPQPCGCPSPAALIVTPSILERTVIIAGLRLFCWVVLNEKFILLSVLVVDERKEGDLNGSSSIGVGN